MMDRGSWPKMSDFLQLDTIAVGFFVKFHIKELAGRRREDLEKICASIRIVCNDFKDLICLHLSQHLGHFQKGERCNGFFKIEHVICLVFKTCRIQISDSFILVR